VKENLLVQDRSGRVIEELNDRELAVLRALNKNMVIL
jgi:hypothetical protein